MPTDREIIKEREAARAGTYGLAGKASDEYTKIHQRSGHFTKVGTENAETNVAATVMFTVNRKSKISTVKYLTGTATATDNTDYLKITVTKQTAGAAATTVATYNTHGGAQGTITANVPASFSVVANSDSTLAAGDSLHYAVTKHSATGKVLAIGTFTVDFEEV
jgi:hypothetical protein